MRASVSLPSVSRAYYPILSTCPVHHGYHGGNAPLENGGIPYDFRNITPSPQFGRQKDASCVNPTNLPSSVSLTSVTTESYGQSQRPTGSITRSSTTTTITIRSPHGLGRNTTRLSHRPSTSITSIKSASSLAHGGHSRRSSISVLGCLPETGTRGRDDQGQNQGITTSGSLASVVSPARSRSHTRKRRAQKSINSVDTRRSYTVFQRRLFRFKRQERILLLDKQWVHVLPLSTKSLNAMFDTRKSVSYHIRLLAYAKMKSGGKNSIITIGFKKGIKGRLKRYNFKVGNRLIAAEIIQQLWQLRAQFSNDKGLRIELKSVASSST